eukprot:CCRYP_020843-RA/>CCRYP_020843-RA protein AED:0.04 eAED:0.04 QI:357/1/1/1/1/1/3/420/350
MNMDKSKDVNGNGAPGNVNPNVPSNIYLLNVAFYSFALFALGQMFVAVWIARSEAMIGDSSAMVIDSLTYLFNSYAERIKNLSLSTDDDDHLTEREKELKRLGRTRQRLLLEIAPPLCSVLTLIGLTIYIIKDALDTLARTDFESGEGDGSSSYSDPNVGIMFFFSGLNLALDILNVTCFARAKHAFGFAVIDEDRHRYMLAYDGSLHNVYADSLRVRSEINLSDDDPEEEAINVAQGQNYSSITNESNDTHLQINREKTFKEVNLNMCSAYTHVFADTLRSTAVLLAAGISYTFKVGAPAVVDAVAALAVSLIILMSLGPLLRGIFHAWRQLRRLSEIEGNIMFSNITR